MTASAVAVVGRLLRGVAALAATAAVLVGAPILLWWLGAPLLPDHVPSGPEVLAALTRPDDGRLFLGALTLAGFLAWAMLASSILAEIVSLAVRRPTARIPLPGFRASQALAATLIATILAAVASPAPRLPCPHVLLEAAGRWHRTGRRREWAIRRIHRHTPPTQNVVRPAPRPPLPPRGRARRGLFGRLGRMWWSSGTRCGGSRTRPSATRGAGTRSTPSTATASNPTAPTSPRPRCCTSAGPSSCPTTHRQPNGSTTGVGTAGHAGAQVVVAPGDTLTEIAAEHLGTAARYREIYEANRDRRQPDGAALHDPDVIRPGWILTMPSPTAAPPAAGPIGPGPLSPDPPTSPSPAHHRGMSLRRPQIRPRRRPDPPTPRERRHPPPAARPPPRPHYRRPRPARPRRRSPRRHPAPRPIQHRQPAQRPLRRARRSDGTRARRRSELHRQKRPTWPRGPPAPRCPGSPPRA